MTAMGLEGRKHKRRPFDAAALIQPDDGSPPMPCGIADISDGGARLAVQQAELVPEAFTLRLSISGTVRRRCRVAWRSGSEVGVRFEAR